MPNAVEHGGAVISGTFVDVVDLVVPELQRRGLLKTESRPGTYRDELLGNGARLGARHPAARHRRHVRSH